MVLLTPAEIVARFPWMATDGVALGSLGLTGEGWFDGYGLMQAFRRKSRALGADHITGEAVGLDLEGGRVTGVRLADGTAIAAGHVVDAAGPWSREVAAMAGVPLPVEARRRCVFGFEAQAAVPDCPLVIDTSGIWFRPEGEAFITAVSPPPEEDHDGLPLTVDHALFEERIWPALAERVPGVRCDQAAQRLGRLLRVLDLRPECLHRSASGAAQPALRHGLQRPRDPARPGGRPGHRRADRPRPLHDAGPLDLRLRPPHRGPPRDRAQRHRLVRAGPSPAGRGGA